MRRIRRSAALLLLGLCCLFSSMLLGPVHLAAAQQSPLTGFSFLRLEPSARAAAMGGAFDAAHGEDVNALFYNPAALDAGLHRQLSLSYLNHLGGINAGFLAFGYDQPGLGTLAAGLRFLGWGDLQGRDASGGETGTFGASDVALTLGLGRASDERLRYGAALHAVLSSVEAQTATALALDAGVLYHLAGPDLTLSASVHNFGVTLSSLGATNDELPLDLRVGFAKRLQYVPLLVSVTGYGLHAPGAGAPDGTTALDNVLRHLAFGGEFLFSEAFRVRFGYNHRRHEDLKMKSRLDLAGFGTGFGLKISRFYLDYAFNSWSSLGGLHQFTVRTSL